MGGLIFAFGLLVLRINTIRSFYGIFFRFHRKQGAKPVVTLDFAVMKGYNRR